MTHNIVWEPTEYHRADSNIATFVEERGYDGPEDLVPETETELSQIWDEMAADIGIKWREPYDDVVDLSDGAEFASWFQGGKLNATETILDAWATQDSGRIMYEWRDETGATESVTYEEMLARTNQLANALSDRGVSQGDVVGITFPMHPNGFVAALACLRIGAVFTQIFPGYGPEAMGQRLNDAGAEWVITVDGYRRNGSVTDLAQKVSDALAFAPTVSDVVIYNHAGDAPSVNEATVHNWTKFTEGYDDRRDPVVVDADQTAFIAYSSGTTGKPKGTIHTHASLLAMGNKEAHYHFDVSTDDTFLWVTDYGWIIVPVWMMAGAPALGATTVLLEGSPFTPSEDRIWRMIETYEATMFGIAPTGARTLQQSNSTPRNDYDLESLRILGSTGEPWDVETWHWFLKKVGGGDAPIINASGGTELAGAILAPTPMVPLKPGTLYGPAPGVAANILDEDGQPADEGYLVVEQPIPGMTHSLTSGDERYLKEYWQTFDGAWNQNDWAERDTDGFWYITGRADDTMNIAGRRVTAPAIEEVIASHPAVTEAVVIAVPDAEKGQSPIAFVTTDETVDNIKFTVTKQVASELGAPFRPDKVFVVERLPRTQTGKIPRNVIKNSYLDESVGNTSTLDVPEALEELPQRSNANDT